MTAKYPVLSCLSRFLSRWSILLREITAVIPQMVVYPGQEEIRVEPQPPLLATTLLPMEAAGGREFFTPLPTHDTPEAVQRDF